MFTLLLFDLTLNISDKTRLANLNSRFHLAFRAKFDLNISLHSLINIWAVYHDFSAEKWMELLKAKN